MQNPFIIKGRIPSELFCDRVEETQILGRHILNGRNVLLTSSRRMGKTGLILHTFEQPQISQVYNTVFFDILQTGCLRDFVFVFGKAVFDTLKGRGQKALDAFTRAVRSLCGELSYDPVNGTPKFSISIGSIREPETSLSELFGYIEKSGRRCLIAIDEFQRISAYPEKNVEALLRTYVQQCSNAEFIFSGSERHILSQMFSSYSRPFYNSTTPLHLDVIPADRYSEFVRKNFVSAGKTVEDGGIDMIYALVCGNTFCLQNIFNVAFSLTPENGHCDGDTMKEAVRDILGTNARYYESVISSLPMSQKELLVSIAKENRARKVLSGEFIRRHCLPSSSIVQKALLKLISSELIGYDDCDGGKTYFLNDIFFRLWILGFYNGDSEFA